MDKIPGQSGPAAGTRMRVVRLWREVVDRVYPQLRGLTGDARAQEAQSLSTERATVQPSTSRVRVARPAPGTGREIGQSAGRSIDPPTRSIGD